MTKKFEIVSVCQVDFVQYVICVFIRYAFINSAGVLQIFFQAINEKIN